MAGKRQHYVPRFLQRGFLKPTNGDAELTWLHRRGMVPRPVSIRDVGVGEYFYSKPDQTGAETLDDLITALEGSLDEQVKSLRVKRAGELVDGRAAAELVTHLVFRTEHVRSFFASGATKLFDELGSMLAEMERLRSFLGVDTAGGGAVFGKAIDRALAGMPFEALGWPEPAIRRVLSFGMREHFDEFLSEQRPFAAGFLERLTAEVPRLIREAHNAALAKDQTGGTRIDVLSTFHWTLEAIDEAILPDCIALALVDDRFVPLLLAGSHETNAVVAPISRTKLLVGRRQAIDLQLEEINAAAASCSASFFISASADNGSELIDNIGRGAAAAINEIIEQALADVVRAPAPGRDLQMASGPATGALNVTLRLEGVGDEQVAGQLKEIISGVLSEVGRELPIGDLDGITIASDYPSALRNLERGDERSPQEETRPLAYGQAVAKPVSVVREGSEKTHLVFDACLSVLLLSSEPEDRSVGLHLLVSMLAHVAHATLYEAPLRGQFLSFADPVARLLWPSVGTWPGDYYTSRESAFVAPDYAINYTDLVRNSLAHAKAVAAAARSEFANHQNVDLVLEAVLPAAEAVLRHCAQWCGHKHGLPEGVTFQGDDLAMQLSSDGLGSWLALFERDLQALYAEPALEPASLVALTRHMERLLWVLGVCPWPITDDDVFVSLPG